MDPIDSEIEKGGKRQENGEKQLSHVIYHISVMSLSANKQKIEKKFLKRRRFHFPMFCQPIEKRFLFIFKTVN